MPVSSFTADPVFDWTRDPVGACAPNGKPPGTRCRPKPKPKKRPRKRKAKKKPKGSAKLSPQCRTTLVDRLEAAIAGGLIELCDEDMPADRLDFTLAELALLQRILFPEEYLDPHRGRKPPKPTATAPGSAERIAEYAMRVAQKRVLVVAGDATATGAHEPGLKIEQRKNGSGVKVVGWDDEG